MATYVTPVGSQTDPDAPLTSDLAKRWDNNLVAFYELDATAPKMKVSVEADSAGSIVDPTVVDALGDFNGVILEGFVGSVGSGGSCDIQVALSDDGVTYATATTIISIGVSGVFNGTFKAYINLADGVMRGAWQGSTTDPKAGSIAATLVGGGASVSHVRVTATTATHDVYTIGQRVGEII